MFKENNGFLLARAETSQTSGDWPGFIFNGERGLHDRGVFGRNRESKTPPLGAE